MPKQTPAVEWHIAEDEGEWVRLSAQQTDAAAPFVAHQLSFYKNACWALAFILGLLLILGGWWWQHAPTDAQSAVADYNPLVTDLIHEFARPIVRKDSSMLTGIPTGASVTALEPTIVLVEAQGEQAVVSIVTSITAGQPRCRQQRLYHHTIHGWQRIVLAEQALTALRQQQTVPAPLSAVCN